MAGPEYICPDYCSDVDCCTIDTNYIELFDGSGNQLHLGIGAGGMGADCGPDYTTMFFETKNVWVGQPNRRTGIGCRTVRIWDG